MQKTGIKDKSPKEAKEEIKEYAWDRSFSEHKRDILNQEFVNIIIDYTDIINNQKGKSLHREAIDFMYLISRLYLDYYQYNLKAIDKISGKYKDRINELRNVFYISAIDQLESLLTTSFLSDEWLICCRRRSNIEAFNTLNLAITI